MVYQDDTENERPIRSRPGTSLSTHSCVEYNEKDALSFLSQKIRVSSATKSRNARQQLPVDLTVLPGQDFYVHTREVYRPKSASTVLQYSELPIVAEPNDLGKPTRGSILRNLRRAQSATSACSGVSWITDNRRLCNIRDYYRLCKPEKLSHSPPPNGESMHAFLTGARYNSAHWLDSLTLGKRGLYIYKENLKNVFDVPRPSSGTFRKSKTIIARKIEERKQPMQCKSLDDEGEKTRDIGVNTEQHYLSINSWHAASWQQHLPAMYGPKKEKYNPYASVPVRSKRVPSEYRDPSVITLRINASKESANQNSVLSNISIKGNGPL